MYAAIGITYSPTKWLDSLKRRMERINTLFTEVQQQL
jgi:hypothetical protein